MRWSRFLTTMALFLVGIPSMLGAPAQARPSGTPLRTSGDAYIYFDSATNIWTIGTSKIEKQVQLDGTGKYKLISLKNKITGTEWFNTSYPSSEFKFGLGGKTLTGDAGYVLDSHSTRVNSDGSITLAITLTNNANQLKPTIYITAYPKTSVLKQEFDLTYTGTNTVDVTNVYSLYSVVMPSVVTNLRALTVAMPPAGPFTTNLTGTNSVSFSSRIPSVSIHDTSKNEGLFFGIEYSAGYNIGAGYIDATNCVLAGGAKYTKTLQSGSSVQSVPSYFGFYSNTNQANGTSAESANYVSLYLTPNRNENLFQYNSWYAYHADISEVKLRLEVDKAAKLGYSAFVIDYGWFVTEGDWNPHPLRFPSGMSAFAEYVHSKGMKFGLWLPFHQVASSSKVYKEHPEWIRGSVLNAYHLNYALPEVQQWMKETFKQKLAEYKVDWVKTDWRPFGAVSGDPDAEYEQVKGFYAVYDYLMAQFPNIRWEMCDAGGHVITMGEQRFFHAYWLKDGSPAPALSADYRRDVDAYGIFMPFQKGIRWFMNGDSDYEVRSVMLGYPGTTAYLNEFDTVKDRRVREHINLYNYLKAKNVISQNPYRLLDVPNNNNWDAMDYTNPAQTDAAIFVFRGSSNTVPTKTLYPMNLNPNSTYHLFSQDGKVLPSDRTGSDLMAKGININLNPEDSEIIFLSTTDSFIPMPPLTPNLARGARVSASSTAGMGNEALNLNDGGISTGWRAASGTTSGEWVKIDLGASTDINTVVTELATPSQGITAYKIQTSSDDTNWTDQVTSTTVGLRNIDRFTTVSARYVRLYVLSANSVPNVAELEVYNNVTIEDYLKQESNLVNWTVKSGDWFVASEPSGNRMLAQNSKVGTALLINDNITWSDYSVETKVKLLTGTNVGFTIKASGNTGTNPTVTYQLEYYVQPNAANLALGKKATASSVFSKAKGNEADKANDGNILSRWNSEINRFNNEWLKIDLGTNTEVNRVVIKENATFQRISAYKVQVSTDDVHWTDVAFGTTVGPNRVEDFTTVNARYVRLFVLNATNCPTIDEFEIYKIDGAVRLYQQGDASKAGESSFAMNPSTWYTLRAEMSDDKISFYVNDELKGTLTNVTPTQKAIGLFTSGSSAFFDDLRVYQR